MSIFTDQIESSLDDRLVGAAEAILGGLYDRETHPEWMDLRQEATNALYAYVQGGGVIPDLAPNMQASFGGVAPSNVYEAFLQIQSDLVDPGKNASNPFFSSSYAKLDQFLPSIRHHCNRNGCFIKFETRNHDGVPHMQVTLVHAKSGTSESANFPFPNQNAKDSQVRGAQMTYMMRYAVLAFWALAPTDDDDGNSSSDRELKRQEEDIKSKARAAAIAGIGVTIDQVKTFTALNRRPDYMKMDDETFAKLISFLSTDKGREMLPEAE